MVQNQACSFSEMGIPAWELLGPSKHHYPGTVFVHTLAMKSPRWFVLTQPRMFQCKNKPTYPQMSLLKKSKIHIKDTSYTWCQNH